MEIPTLPFKSVSRLRFFRCVLCALSCRTSQRALLLTEFEIHLVRPLCFLQPVQRQGDPRQAGQTSGVLVLFPFHWGPILFPRVLSLLCLAACAPSVFDGLTCVFSGLAQSQLAVMPPCRSPLISPHFGEQGRLHVRPHDHSLQVCFASLFACCGASQHERRHVCWLVGCLLLEVCSSRVHAVEIPTLPVDQCYSLHILYLKGMLRPSFVSPCRKEGPPCIWDTHGISGNVFYKSTCIFISSLSSRIESMEYDN